MQKIPGKRIKREFSSRIELRYTPKLKFKLDNLKKEYQNIDKALDNLNRKIIKNEKKNKFNGWIFLDKPIGISSNSALQKVRKIFNFCKAGYVGTLDPLASGFLPIALGRCN